MHSVYIQDRRCVRYRTVRVLYGPQIHAVWVSIIYAIAEQNEENHLEKIKLTLTLTLLITLNP